MVGYVAVSMAAFVVAVLTLYSGFGLGTLLMPVFALFFPLETAVAATAVVHLANNVFKVGLVGCHADRKVLARFAVPAVLASLVGAFLLSWMSGGPPLHAYILGGREHTVTLVKVVIAVVMAGFAVLELSPRFERLEFGERMLPVGGLLSGFFGGLSGHQGALRSAFLVRAGMSKEALIGTGVMAAVLVDFVRICVYGADIVQRNQLVLGAGGWPMVGTATLAAFLGSWLGARMLKKVTLKGVRRTVGVLLLLLALALGTGLV